jgi:type I restriction enzyme S subunit
VDALLAALDRLIAKQRDLKQAAMQQLLTGQTRLPGFDSRSTSWHRSVFGVFPSDWTLQPLSQVSAFITKGSTPTTYGFQWVSSGVLFLRSECVSERGLDLSQSMFVSPQAHHTLKRSEVKAGDLLMTITGNVGRVVHLNEDFPTSNINQHIARIRMNDDHVAVAFVFHFLSQPLVRKYYNQITTGQAYPQISLTQVRDTILPFPPLPEQTAIAAVLTDMDAALTALEQRRDKTRALKQGMMQELLTGRTRLV